MVWQGLKKVRLKEKGRQRERERENKETKSAVIDRSRLKSISVEESEANERG